MHLPIVEDDEFIKLQLYIVDERLGESEDFPILFLFTEFLLNWRDINSYDINTKMFIEFNL